MYVKSTKQADPGSIFVVHLGGIGRIVDNIALTLFIATYYSIHSSLSNKEASALIPSSVAWVCPTVKKRGQLQYPLSKLTLNVRVV